MSLYKKTILVASLTFITTITLLYFTAQFILLRGYEQLEREDTIQNVQRVLNAVQDNIAVLTAKARDWARWDDTRNFVTGEYADFTADNLMNESFIDLQVNLMVFVDDQGQVVAAKAVDSDLKTEVPIPATLLDHLKSGSPLLNHDQILSEKSGLLFLPEGPMMVVSLPILNSATTGPINGTLVWGCFLKVNEIERLERTTQLSLQIEPYAAAELPLSPENPIAVGVINDQTVAGYALLDDLYGNPALILRVDLPRNIYQQGQSSLTVFLVLISLIAAAFTLAAAMMTDRLVLSRIANLSATIIRVRKTDDPKTPVKVEGDDEIAHLAVGLKDMLAALAQSRDKLEEANRELEQRVARRTADLSEANTKLREEIAERQQTQTLLAQARDQAIEALKVKSQIIANVGHDARTPLTTINLRTEMLQLGKYGPVNEKQQEVLENILVSSQQLMGFINNMLSEAQFTNGKITLASKPFKPSQIIHELLLVLIPLAERKKIELHAEIDPNLPETFLGDPDRLKQIITNLVDNAIKFTNSGGVTIKADKLDSSYWQLQVIDTGRGMSEEALKHIFEPFWQVDGSLTREVNRGVGLGLSIVKQLAELMGGTVKTESVVGVGTSFIVTLPYEEYYAEPAGEAIPHPDY